MSAEEVWSWWREGSIHRAEWPDRRRCCASDGGDPLVYEVAAEVLAEVRKAKSTQKVSLATAGGITCMWSTPPLRLAALEAARQDVCDAGKIAKLEVEVGQSFSVRVELPEAPQPVDAP